MADLRETLKAELDEWMGRDMIPIARIEYLLAAHPPDEAEKRLVEARDIIDRASQLATWSSFSSLQQLSRDCDAWLAKPAPEPDAPKAARCGCGLERCTQCSHHPHDGHKCDWIGCSCAPSSSQVRVPESFSTVMRFGGRTALGLNPNEIEELWRAITNEIELRIEARAAARK